MRISIFGSGYVGFGTGSRLCRCRPTVLSAWDIDETRVQRLRAGEVPFFEPGLSNMVLQAVDEGLLDLHQRYTNSRSRQRLFCFICVGTPSGGRRQRRLAFT